jgi:hypothetical protein
VVTVRFVLLSQCHLIFVFAFCYVLINCFMFLIIRFACFLVLYVLLYISCVLCFCIVSPNAYSCLFSICVQYYLQLSPGGNPNAVNKCHII